MANYVLVGAGGTGSHLLRPLYMYLDGYEADKDPDWRLFIHDGDHVEDRNLARQVFEPEEIGLNKAEALAARYPDHLRAKTEFIGANNIEDAIKDGDIVLIAADNYWIRLLIERHVQTLQNAVVINGGNESINGSVQIYVRTDGKDITPRLSWLHPEIENADPSKDKSAMNCAVLATLPGGEQTVLANNTSANLMLAALYRHHQQLTTHPQTEEHPDWIPWTEFSFDHQEGLYSAWDVRTARGWDAPLSTDSPANPA